MPQRPRPRVLVTGGSITGPALAWALHREGFETVVLERSPQQRTAGQNIDIRGLGHEVLHRMGIHDAVMANRTGEIGTRFVDESGRGYAEIASGQGHDGPTAEVEILRGQLSQILVDLIADDVEIRYGDFVTAVNQDDTGVEVATHRGHHERFDLLLVAEGRSSRTRRLLFADRTRYRDKGLSVAYGTIDRRPDDDRWWNWLTTTEGRTVMTRPDNLGTRRASLSFRAPAFGFENLPVDAQLHILRERFRTVGWETGRILDGFADRPDEFYTERMAQVVVSRWSTGRVALVGDAAWGSGPTGMGTTLALVGSHILAGELGAARDRADATPADAFSRYEHLMRRYADRAQTMAPGIVPIMNPTTGTGLAVSRALHRIMATRPVRGIAARTVLTTQVHAPTLPAYPRLRTG